MVRLDRINLQIIDRLLADARASIVDIADTVDRAESTVRERVDRLERDGIIQGYRARIAPERVGFDVAGRVRADCDRTKIPDLARELSKIPNVTRAVLTTGDHPLAIDLAARDLVELERLLERRLSPLGLMGQKLEAVVRTLVEDRPVPVRTLLDQTEVPYEVDMTVWRPIGHQPGQGLAVRRASASRKRSR